MPCRDESDLDREYHHRTLLRLDEATRAACELGRLVQTISEGRKGGIYVSLETRSWLSRHEEQDARRRRQETEQQQRQTERKKALSKLTAAERKLLGV